MIQLRSIENWCDKAVIFFYCLLIGTLPISIALVESFSGAVIFFFLIKKVAQAIMLKQWKALLPPVNPIVIAVAVNIFVIFISLFFSQFPTTSIIAFVAKFLQGCFLYFAFIDSFKSFNAVYIFVVSFLSSSILLSLDGIYQFIYRIDFLRGNHLVDNRVSASMRHSNDFGAYLIIVIAIAFALLFALKNSRIGKYVKVTVCIALLGAVVNLGLTFSRGAWLGAIIAIIFIGFKNKSLHVGLLSIVLFLFCFSPLMSSMRNVSFVSDDTGTEKYLVKDFIKGGDTQVKKIQEFFTEHFSGMGRIGFWKDAFEMIQLRPWFGSGLNTYSKVASSFEEGWRGYPHNCYLQMTAEVGFIGLLAFLALVGVAIGYTIKIIKRTKDELWRLILIGALAGLIGFLVQSSLDTTLYSVQLGNFMWMILGLMGSCHLVKIDKD